MKLKSMIKNEMVKIELCALQLSLCDANETYGLSLYGANQTYALSICGANETY